MSIYLILLLIWVHWVADFVLQTDEMAVNKSRSNAWLGWHVLVYSIPIYIIGGAEYAVVNLGLHFVVDVVSSRITSHLWQKEERHWFFVVIGIDQALHLTCLILTAPLMTPRFPL